jgi:hypothetical protein
MSDRDKILDNILDHNPKLDAVTIVGTEEYEHVDAAEHEHYLILPDPMLDSDQSDTAWTMLLLQDPYKDFLVRVSDIITEGEDIQFDWEPLSIPEDADEPEDHTHFLNYLTGCIANHMYECWLNDAVEMRDEDGKVIKEVSEEIIVEQ